MASLIRVSAVQVTGWVTMPASDRLTMSTCSAWSSADMLRCSTPTPPWRAIAIAMRASVTVSMAEDTSGVRSVMLRVSRVVVSTSLGSWSETAGWSSTSSKVRPRGANLAGSSAGRSSGKVSKPRAVSSGYMLPSDPELRRVPGLGRACHGYSARLSTA